MTRRKMMKMLMILSRDLSNHTIICAERREKARRSRRKGGKQRGGGEGTESVLL